MAVMEMAESLQRVTEQPSELSVEERKLLSVAYGSTAGSRRAAWRIITGVEQKEKFEGMEQQASHARECVAKVEGELQRIRDGIPALMDEILIPSARTGEKKENLESDVADMKFDAGAGEDPFVKMKDLITDLINRLQAEASSEANQKFFCNEETSKATEKKEDLEADIAKHTSKLETAVSEGHPDEICDQISDVVIDACLTCDKYKVTCETCVKDNTVMVARGITVTEKIDHETVVQSVLQKIGIESFIDDLSSVDSKGLNYQDCEVLLHVNKQSTNVLVFFCSVAFFLSRYLFVKACPMLIARAHACSSCISLSSCSSQRVGALFLTDTILPGYQWAPQWVPVRTPTVHWGPISGKAAHSLTQQFRVQYSSHTAQKHGKHGSGAMSIQSKNVGSKSTVDESLLCNDGPKK